MNWFAILMPFFMDLIERCQEDRDPAKIEAGLNNPGMVEKYAMMVVVRKRLKLRGRKLRKKVKKGMAELRKANPSDIREAMDEVTSRAN